jgi:curved DNA-binding protein CbpA
MGEEASAYAALGLEPGADSAAIERAYRKLIKEHHPDREGGDGYKAAEINRAYRELRAARNLREPLELNHDWAIPAREGNGWIATALLAAAAVVLLVVAQRQFASSASIRDRPALHREAGAAGTDLMDQPLQAEAIEEEVRSAVRLARNKDEMALASASRDCHRALRSDPTLLRLDRCAAFDDAVVQLQDRDPLRDQGPFGELAVTGRLWSGATAMSDDSVAIDSRLRRIRQNVEVELASVGHPGPAVASRNNP